MKTPPFIITLVALTLAFAPQLLRRATAEPIGPRYSAELISPTAGEVLVPGTIYRISWNSTLPHLDASLCETEIQLSLDGGRTYNWITGERDARVKYFDWTVPNTPTNKAVLNLHFGCLGYYPESESVQLHSVFAISGAKR